MPTHVEGTFTVTSWNEEPATGLDEAPKVSLARIGQRLTGGIEAETVSDMVMAYREDGTADFVGYQRVRGRIGPSEGSFVLRASGQYDGTAASTDLEVVAGSATGQLEGLVGTGRSVAPMGVTGEFSLDYEM